MTTNFERQRSREFPALGIEFSAYLHRATGARHFHLKSTDTNNAFMVAFPTLPVDSSGVAHILEHTTLCGSKRYPVRDPFFMMLRRSLNTFMNAFTSGDSTAYPFATQNLKDFRNLMSVYLDAVFFPNLDPLDFAQEGWRVEFDESTGERALEYKGVVYNEMKGAMSAPSTQIWQHLYSALFPDTVYRHNSGGDPLHIPELSYEQLTKFHEKYYHPSHAVFMTFGSFPVEDHQTQIEQEALCHFQRRDEDIVIATQPRFTQAVRQETRYAIADPSELDRGTHVVWGWLLGEAADARSLFEAHFVAAILLDHSASPLRQFLETTPLAEAPSELCGVDDSSRELVLCCGVEGTNPEHVDTLSNGIAAVIRSVAEHNVAFEDLEGIIDRMEMAQRDVGNSGYPYGLELMSRMLPAVLYGHEPIELLDIETEIEHLRTSIRDAKFVPALLRRLLIDNLHHACVVMAPDTDKADEDECAEKAQLTQRLATMDANARQQVRVAAEALRQRQDEAQDEEILPKVTLCDVPAGKFGPEGDKVSLGSVAATKYEAATNGLIYVQRILAMPNLSEEELKLLPLFCEYLTELGAGQESYLDTQVRRAQAGTFAAYAAARTPVAGQESIIGRFVIQGKGLARKTDLVVNNVFSLLEDVRFDETARITDLLTQTKVDAEASITERGHVLAMHAAARALSTGAYLDDLWEGPTSIQVVQAIAQSVGDSEQRLNEITEAFHSIRAKLLAAPHRVLLVGEQSKMPRILECASSAISPGSGADYSSLSLANKGPNAQVSYLANSQINFCAKAYPAVQEGHADAPALAVLAKYLVDGFLHAAIREQGGAYGAGARLDADSATFRFFSYRDPQLGSTLQAFDRSLDWLAESNDPQRLEESILGVVRGLDQTKTPAGEAISEFYDRYDGRTREARESFRQAVLNTTYHDLAKVADTYLQPGDGRVAAITHRGHESELDALHLDRQQL